MFVIDSETHPVGVMDIDQYRPELAGTFAPPTMAELPNRHGGASAGPRDWYVKDLIEAMDQHGVTKSVVMCGGVQVTNDNLAAVVRQHPDRLMAFASYEHFQPNSRDIETTVKAVAAMERGVRDLGFKGIGELILERFSPAPPDELYLELRPIMEVCKKYQVPVFIHTGYDPVTFRLKRSGDERSSWSYLPAPLKYRDPIYLDDVALEYPHVPMIVAHMGGRFLRHFEGALMLAFRHKNVYLTTAGAPPEFIARAAAEVGADRMIWGSDWAWRSVKGKRPSEELGQARNFASLEKAKLSAAQREAILGRTLANLLGIPGL